MSNNNSIPLGLSIQELLSQNLSPEQASRLRFLSHFRNFFTQGTLADVPDKPAGDGNKPVVHKNESTLCAVDRPLSSDILLHLRDRETGLCNRRNLQSARRRTLLSRNLPDYISQQLPAILREKELKLGTYNKVFASKWLNKSQVVMGTKCNKLLVMDVNTNRIDHIPSLKSSKHSEAAKCPCGIHAIAINPSRTMLATGGKNTNDVAVYQLPTFDPLCVGEQAHSDWIFDMEWIDDGLLVTGSRDDSVALWNLEDVALSSSGGDGDSTSYRMVKAMEVKPCKAAEKVRALSLNKQRGMMGVLSMNARLHFWDIGTFTQCESVELPWRRENVCVTNSEDYGLFAVGSQSFITLLDQRVKRLGKRCSIQLPAKYREERGIRSLSFNQHMMTVGSGDGKVLFYDMRARKFLSLHNGDHCELKVSDGWLKHDMNYQQHFLCGYFPNAIYTHCYDEWNARLFVAGGPLPAGLYGNYAGIFY